MSRARSEGRTMARKSAQLPKCELCPRVMNTFSDLTDMWKPDRQ